MTRCRAPLNFDKRLFLLLEHPLAVLYFHSCFQVFTTAKQSNESEILTNFVRIAKMQ